MIYTSTKSLQFLSVPVYTIFKNLTTIVIAYGEVLWFGGSVTPSALFSFGLMVLSSVVAAWADIQHALSGGGGIAETVKAAEAAANLTAGYAWMGMNVFCTAAYVLSMRKVIKKMNFGDWDSMFDALHYLTMLIFDSHVLQQSPHHPSSPHLLPHFRELVWREHQQELPSRDSKHPHDWHDILWTGHNLHLILLCMVHSSHLIHNLLHGWSPEQIAYRSQWFGLLRCPCHIWKCHSHLHRIC